jgi:hypothetical protein
MHDRYVTPHVCGQKYTCLFLPCGVTVPSGGKLASVWADRWHPVRLDTWAYKTDPCSRLSVGRTMAQAVNHRHLNTEAGFDPCQSSSGQSGTGAGFSPSTPVSPVSIIPPLLHTHSFTYHRRYITSVTVASLIKHFSY